jgi:hypothetical protein
MPPSDQPSAYRDALRAAQDRIAQLEEQLAAREEEDGDAAFDAEIAELARQRRLVARGRDPRVRTTRALLTGLFTAAASSIPLMMTASVLPHPNLARAALVAITLGVVLAAVVFCGGSWLARTGAAAIDRKLGEAKRRREEVRRERALERELRAAREARGEPGAGVRIASTPEDVADELGDEEIEVRPTRRRARR